MAYSMSHLGRVYGQRQVAGKIRKICNGRTEEVDERACGDVVFVAVGVLDDQADANGGHGTGEAEGLSDVARGGDRGVVYDLEVRVEVGLDGCVEDR